QNSGYPVGRVGGGPSDQDAVPVAGQDGAIRVGQQRGPEEPGHVAAAGPGGLPPGQLALGGDGIPTLVVSVWRRRQGDPFGVEERRESVGYQVEAGEAVLDRERP